MDITAITRDALSNWSDETERGKLLSGLTYHLTDLSHSSPLSSCLYIMIESLAPPTPGEAPTLSPSQLAAFLAEVKLSFPSSSTEETTNASQDKSDYAELVLDLVWTIDATLEDQLAEIAVAIKADWTTAREAAKADAMDVDGKPSAKDDKPPEKSSKPETERARLVSEAHRKALAEFVRDLVLFKGVVSHTLAVERLETPILMSSGLVKNTPLFERKMRQTRTSLFYKQTKFNLLREESEGYSKLIVELLSHHDQPASFTWQRVVSLIGFFDLDPHRVLDLIFDVMESSVTTKWRWFLDLLREAGWARYDTQAGVSGKGKERAELQEQWIAPSQYEGKGLEEILKEAESCEPLDMGLDEKMTDIPAQLLGFKFSKHVSNQPDTPSSPKKELYLMVAILIREGIVSLPALYPHLYPTEDDMKTLEVRHQKALKEQAMPKRTNNALTRAAPLSEDADGRGYRPRTATSSTAQAPLTSAPTGPRKVDPPNHKMGLLRALLSVGALRPALWILTKHPWMFGPFSALADLYLRLLECSLEPLYSRISFATRSPEETAAMTTPAPGSSITIPPKITLTDLAPEPPRTGNATFEFFYNRWKDWIPLCETSGDIQTLFEPLLRFIGVHAHRNLTLMTKLGRLGKAIVESEADSELQNKEFWKYMLSTYLLPALSFQRSNQTFSTELWSFVRHYRITERWQIYARWREVYTETQEMRNKHAEVNRAVKDILRRVSALPNQDRIDRKEYDQALARVKQTARDFCKFAHTNPCIAFSVLVDQIEGYGRDENAHFVELIKLLAPMSYDVFLSNIVGELSSVGVRDVVKEDGVTPTDWLQGLAGFIGHLGYGARPGTVEFKVIFQVLANDLKNNLLHNLIVFEELIQKMSGIEAYNNLSDSQALAMAGGKHLRIEGSASRVFGVLATKPLAFQKSSQRLIEMLQSSSFALPLLVLLAQQRQLCCFVASEKTSPKLTADIFDNCQRVLFQLIYFLSADMTPDVYAAFMPSLKDLCLKFSIEPSIAWHMLRPKLSATVMTRTQADAAMEREAQLREKAKAQANAAKTETSPPSKPTSGQSAPAPSVNGDAMDVDIKENGVPTVPDVPAQPAPEISKENDPVDDIPQANGIAVNGVAHKLPSSTWHPEVEPLFQEVRAILPEAVAQKLGAAFYSTFWQLSLYDIHNLGERYTQEIIRMRQLDAEVKGQIKQYGTFRDWIRKEYDVAKRYNDMHPHDKQKELPMIPMDFPIQTDRQLLSMEKSIPKFSQMSTILLNESKEQTAWVGLTRRRLQKEKDHWFAHIETYGDRDFIINLILQHCVVPRALLSPSDATFCAKFIKHLHSIGTKNFMTLRMYDRIFSDQLTSIIFGCTEMESRNYARMLHDILIDLHAWFNEKDKYTSEAQGLDKGPLPGFQKRWFTGGGEQVQQSDLLTHEEFQRLLRKFHQVLSNTFIKCLESQEYMHVRNAILMMVELLPVFPLHPMSNLRPHPPFGVTIEERLKSFIAVETRQELKMAAGGYADKLQQRRKEWMPPAPAVPAAETVKAPVKVPAATGAPTGPRQQEALKTATGVQINGAAAQTAKPSTQPPTQPAAAKPAAPSGQAKVAGVPAGTPTGPSAQSRTASSTTATVPKPPDLKVAVPPSTSSAPAATLSAIEAIPKPDIIRRTGRSDASGPSSQAATPSAQVALPKIQPSAASQGSAAPPTSSQSNGAPPRPSQAPSSTQAPQSRPATGGAVPSSAPPAQPAPADRPVLRSTTPLSRFDAAAPSTKNAPTREPAKPFNDNRPTTTIPVAPSQPPIRPDPTSTSSSQPLRKTDADAGGRSRPPPEINGRPATESSVRVTTAPAQQQTTSNTFPNSSQDTRNNEPVASAGSRDLPQRPTSDVRAVGGPRPISPPRVAANNARGPPPGRKILSRSRSPDPRRGPRMDPADDGREPRGRNERDERDRFPRGPEINRDRQQPRDYSGRGPRGDLYRPGEYPDDRRDVRPSDRPADRPSDRPSDRPPDRPLDRPDVRNRDMDRAARDRERPPDRDREREREDRDRGRDRGRERDNDRERDRRPDNRIEAVHQVPREDPQSKAADEVTSRRTSTDDSKGRKRTHEPEEVQDGRELKKHRRSGRRERGDRTPSDKAEVRRSDRDRDRERRRDEPRRDEDKGSSGNAGPPVTPSSGAPPSGPRAMNRPGPASPVTQPSRRDTANDHPSRRDSTSDRQAQAPPRQDPPPQLASTNVPVRPPQVTENANDRPSRRDTPPQDGGRSGPSLADRLGPRRAPEGGDAPGSQDPERSGGRKRGYSEREGESRDESSESRDPNKRQRRIDRSGAREREQNKSSRMFSMAVDNAQKQDTSRSGGRSGRRGGGDA